MLDVNEFDCLRIGLATADDIRGWSSGEVKKPETINYRTLKPEREGLFCERIFGPTRDWECSCGRYKRPRYKGVVCEKCGVEVTRAKVRRERMGHIELAAPVMHIWYFKGVPSRLGYLLDLAPKDLDKVIYFAAHMITWVDDEGRQRDQPELEGRKRLQVRRLESRRDADIEARAQKLEADLRTLEDEGAKGEIRRKVKESAERDMKQIRTAADHEINRIEAVWDRFVSLKVQDLEGDESLYREMKARYGRYFRGGMGAQAIQDRLRSFDLDAESELLREIIRSGRGQKKARAIKRLKVVNAFQQTTNHPAAMVLDAIPVIPPDLRPMVQLDGGRFATSDLNDLYRRVINRNNRLKRLLDLGAPEIIVNNEKRMLQESVDALFDNGRRGRPVTGPGNRALKSLSDMLKGKQGRFRQNLLGKRVDYSGRSVIVVGPQLKLHQCGLPKQMALELFKPFVMKRLTDLNHAQNIKAAKRMVERQKPEVWDVLEAIIAEHPVLLNRAPTLHRLGIQAFEPQLVEGKAIKIHPLVCTAFNADFDGDQMAVHLPLSAEAQAEARVLMLSSNNILKPADGRPVTMPTQDMVLGIFFLTSDRVNQPGEGRRFSSPAEAVMAFDAGQITLQTPITVQLPGYVPAPEAPASVVPVPVSTTLGRVLFNEALPSDYPYQNVEVTKKELGRIVNDLAERYAKVQVAATLDKLKAAGFQWATRSGVTVSIEDVASPSTKQTILDGYEAKAEKVERKFERGAITDGERRSELIDIWTDATEEVAQAMEDSFEPTNPIRMMVYSGARGNWKQIRQLAGMRGLVANPKGETIPRPIKASFREGLSVLEFFISTHGARKGLADTALRTADSGYLTRRLVDVSQDVIVREVDCGTRKGLDVVIGSPVLKADGTVSENASDGNETGVYSRILATDAVVPEGFPGAGEVVFPRGTELGDVEIRAMLRRGVSTLRVRTVMDCESGTGVCATCYGRSLATSKRVDVGEAVGIIAAQSIGEPGTQLTMRTFHTGGVAGADITHGLPRVVELFEARRPKGLAPMADRAGRVSIDESGKGIQFVVTPDDGSEPIAFPVSRRILEVRGNRASGLPQWRVFEGDHVEAGEPLHYGTLDPHEVLRIRGRRAVQQFLTDEVQNVYRSQGVSIHDKHIEIIVRQMLRRVTVLESGDTTMLQGELVELPRYATENRRVAKEQGVPASARSQLMGITKAALATESWLSAASFQETTRVLTDAAIQVKSDPLVGLKENVIIGKLIPAGTGLPLYRNLDVRPNPDASDEVYGDLVEDVHNPLGFGGGTGEAAPLDDFDDGGYMSRR